MRDVKGFVQKYSVVGQQPRLIGAGHTHSKGTALTYARRYALFTRVQIAGEDDLDASSQRPEWQVGNPNDLPWIGHGASGPSYTELAAIWFRRVGQPADRPIRGGPFSGGVICAS